MHKDLIAKVLGVTVKSVYNYEKEKRPIITLLEKYYTDEDIIEFLETGNIKRLDEHTISYGKLELHGEILEDNALYSSKDKLERFFSGRVLIKDILIDVLNQMHTSKNIYTLENTKQSLIDQLRGTEANWLKTKTQSKIDLVSEFVENNISKIEAFVMVKNPKIVLNLKTE